MCNSQQQGMAHQIYIEEKKWRNHRKSIYKSIKVVLWWITTNFQWIWKKEKK